MSPSQWVFAPNSGGVKISKRSNAVQRHLSAAMLKNTSPAATPDSISASGVNFATSTLSQSQHHRGQIGLHPIGLRATKNTWNVCGIRPHTSAGCVTLGAMIVGDLLFTVTARDDTSCQSTPPGSFLAGRRRRSECRLNYILPAELPFVRTIDSNGGWVYLFFLDFLSLVGLGSSSFLISPQPISERMSKILSTDTGTSLSRLRL